MGAKQGDLDSDGHVGWDAAPQVGVVTAAGLHASRVSGSPLGYDSERPYLPDLLICRSGLATPLLEAISGTTTS